MNRIDQAFARLDHDGAIGLVTYITAGDPDLARTGKLLRALPGAGADCCAGRSSGGSPG